MIKEYNLPKIYQKKEEQERENNISDEADFGLAANILPEEKTRDKFSLIPFKSLFKKKET